jgi:flavin reductase
MSEPVTKTGFRTAMARLGTAVSIVTTDGPGGRGGFTASAVCSVTDDPPTLLVCMNSLSAQTDRFLTNRRLCVNVLCDAHEGLSAKFAGSERDMDRRFAAGRWTKLATGAPALADALASFDCSFGSVLREGTHYVIFSRVEAVRCRGDGVPLLYADRRYHRLEGEMPEQWSMGPPPPGAAPRR